MSLVNDLLEDIHRRRIVLNDDSGNPLAGVERARRDGRSRGPSRASLGLWCFGVAGAAVLGVQALTPLRAERPQSDPAPSVGARPPFGVPIAPSSAPPFAAPGDAAAGGWISREAAALDAEALVPVTEELYDVDVQPGDGYTRARFRVTGEREYWLEGDPVNGEIEVVISGTRLAAPLPPDAFSGSGLQLREAHNTSTGLHLVLSFEPANRVQSQVVRDERGPVLVVDVIHANARIDAEPSPDDSTPGRPATPPASIANAKDRNWGRIRQTRPAREQPAPEAYRAFDRARELEAAERPNEAIAEYIRALALDPTLHGAREALVALLIEAGKFEAAERHLADGLARTPSHSEYAFLKAQLLVATKQPDRAIAILESLPMPPERRSDALNLLAALYQQKGEYAHAEKLFRNAVRLSPHEGRLWMGLGISLESQQRKTEALAVYKQAESLADFETGPRRWLRSRIRELSTVE